jgi:hypothetical protein
VGSVLHVGSACVTLVPLCLPILSAGPTLYSVRVPTMRPFCTKAVIDLMQRLGVAQVAGVAHLASLTLTCGLLQTNGTSNMRSVQHWILHIGHAGHHW